MASRRRLDAELVRRGLAASTARARELVEEGKVIVGGAPTKKVTRLVDPGEALRVLGDRPRFVSRGGDKLDAALDWFEVDVEGCRVIDVGSSTGGFTDCVLQRGAKEVVAIDVGRNQLHERLRRDPRVSAHERTNVRRVGVDDIGGSADLVVADLSFISLRTVAPALLSLARDGGRLVVLVKPQFEASKAEADKGGGVIRDPAVWRVALDLACTALSDAGAAIMGIMISPITGADGNVEFLASAKKADPSSVREASWAGWCDVAVAAAEAR